MKNLELRFGEKMNVENVENEGKEEKQLKIEGYVNITNTPSDVILSEDGEPFTEKIEKGAFQKAIDQQQNDINLLFEHDKAMILASTKDGSLELQEDDKGLFISATLLKTKLSEHVYEMISKNFIEGMSFGFVCKEAETNTDENGDTQRIVKDLELVEVSIVQQPAYSDSVIEARSKSFELKKAETFNKYNNAKTRIGENLKMKKVQTRSNNTGKNFLVETRSNATTDQGGTSVIPTRVSDQIFARISELSDLFASANIQEIADGYLKLPIETKASQSVKAGIVKEGQTLTPTAFSLKSKLLRGKRVSSAITVTDQMLHMSDKSLLQFIDNSLLRRLALGLDDLAFNSPVGDDDASFYEGLLTSTDIEKVDYDETNLYEKIVEAITLVPTLAKANLKLYCGRATYSQIAKLKDGNGHHYLQNGVVNGVVTTTICGLELIVVDAIEDDGIVLLDPQSVTFMLNSNKPIEVLNIAQDTQNAMAGTNTSVISILVDFAINNEQGVILLLKKKA